MDEETYGLLGLSTDASLTEIKQAYRKLALKWHPDRHPNANDKQRAIGMFAEINTAYAALIRNHEAPLATTAVKSKLRTRLPTPIPSCRTISEDSPTSTSPSNFHSTPFDSNCGSQLTLPSSFNDSFKELERGARTKGSLRPPILVEAHDQASSQTTHDGARDRWKFGVAPELRPLPPRPLARFAERKYSPRSRTNSSPSVVPTWVAMPIRHLDDTPQIVTPGPPLQSLGVGCSGEWAYLLTLTLEDLFSGKHCQFCIVRHFLSGRSKNVIFELDIPSGCRHGTRILCRGIGHELPNGTLQDVAFIIEEVPHTRFSRIEDDLYLDVHLPWTDCLAHRPERISVRGIDGTEIDFIIDYTRHRMLRGELYVKGAGMPVRDRGKVVGRSDLVIRWEIQPPQTKVRQLLDRFFHPKTRR